MAAAIRSFVIMARTDAHAVEGQAAALERARATSQAGADMIFAEALRASRSIGSSPPRAACRCSPTSPSSGRRRCSPRAARPARACGWCSIRCPPSAPPRAAQSESTGPSARDGTQKSVLALMQTRAELYDVLGYHEYEKKLDELFGKEPS